MEFQPSFKLGFLSILLLCFTVNNSMGFIICGMNRDGINACLPSVRGSNPPHPTPKCCNAARGADYKCFCHIRHYAIFPYLRVSFDNVRKLPGKCGITRPLYC